MTPLVDRYLVFGNPIKQSKSPFIHTLFARQTNQSMEYTMAEPEVDGFQQAVDAFFAEGGKGCNVTMPFKLDAFQYASTLTERATLAGAVNTLKRLDDGQVIGDNTDGAGLVQDLLNAQVVLEGARILVIGAGGACRGVLKPLLDQKPSELIITNRTFAKAQELAQIFTEYGKIIAIPANELEGGFDVVINSTASSMSGDLPGVPSTIFTSSTTAYDMAYKSHVTSFNQWAKEHGASKTLDGLGMLVGQAAESFMVWRGLMPGTKQVLRELRKNLEGL
ncbi:shikimate dehydrogenase [Vibrio astriarenae]|uniref:Shikimate dehydrogenase (NADP(+)) n=1 Tax=Vibrio astriarenae TaxID=1481923 RepID=A0A7Z2YCC9_9VIBR|nr:shikimate dehydrogenase [Vibrio astriarenae]QIA62117.1 shikimate dehydrogenase [Vibrio astriarenae]